MDKRKIALIGVTAGLYQERVPELVKKLENFSGRLARVLAGYADIVHTPLVYQRARLESALKRTTAEKADGIILVFLSYSPSLMIAPVLAKYRGLPLLIWNTQKLRSIESSFSSPDMFANHGMHGVQDAANVFSRNKIKFSLITGHYQDRKVLAAVKKWCFATQTVQRLRDSKIARIGGRFPDMGDFAVEDNSITGYLGPRITDISLTSIARESKKIKPVAIQSAMRRDRKAFKISAELSRDVHFRSSRLELALRRIIKNDRLDGLAVNFMAFQGKPGIESIPFMAISKFLGEGMGYAGEGDVLGATSVLILQKLAGCGGFVEMFTTDYRNSRILFAHMGESNPRMAGNKKNIRLTGKKLDLVKPGLSTAMLLFPLKAGKVTLFDIAPLPDGKFKFIISRGQVLKGGLFRGLNCPHFMFKPGIKVEEFLTRYSREGGTHHLAMAYGDRSEDLKYIADILDLPAILV